MTMPFQAQRTGQRGFTLTEVMTAGAIIGTLLRLAFPAYNNSVRKSRRADAKTALLDLAQREERYMSTANVYSTSAPALGYSAGSAFPMPVLTGSTSYYTLSVTVGTPATTFTATAAPSGDQLKDKCGTFTLKQDGSQGASASDCW